MRTLSRFVRKKGQEACKPGSVPPVLDGVCHLSGPAVADRLYRSTLRRIARAGHPQSPVYMNFQHPAGTACMSPCSRWALTPPSHPYRWNPKAQRRFFSSALLYPRGQLSVRKWDALCCPDFPPVPRGTSDRPADCLLWGQRYDKKVRYRACYGSMIES